MPGSHVVTAIVEGQQLGGWISGNFESSLITPADKFVLRMPFDLATRRAVRRDARITIYVDKTIMLDGFIDMVNAEAKADVLEIHGRDRVGRLCDESAPKIDYTGMTILEAVRRLVHPWFPADSITVDNGKNRRLRRGKGRRVASGTEPVITINVRVPRRGQVHPGESRWHVIHEIASRAGLLAGLVAYSSSDGKQFFVGKPNQDQAPQYLFCVAAAGSKMRSTVKDIKITEDDGDRFSSYMCAGAGGQTDTSFGPSTSSNVGRAFDNPFNTTDGTGRDFIHPKRMYLPERAFSSYHDAQRVAELEKNRRDYKRHVVTVETDTFGQDLGTNAPTLFAPDTIARVVWEKHELDDLYLVVDCSYSFDRDNGDTCVMHLVPVGTEIVL